MQKTCVCKIICFTLLHQKTIIMKTISFLAVATFGMHTDNVYLSLVACAVCLILITKK